MSKITQHQAIFYQLYEQRKDDSDKYIPIWKLIGEVYVHQLNKWAFVSYEVSARMSEIKKENPNLFEWKEVIGKTGAKYNAYRINKNVKRSDIVSTKLVEIYKQIRYYDKR